MATGSVFHYAKRALQILRKDGPFELLKKITVFLLNYLIDYDFRSYQLYTIFNYIKYSMKYSAYPNPTSRVVVDASRIEYKIRKSETSIQRIKNGGLGQIQGDDWDIYDNYHHIKENDVIYGIFQRMSEGKNWEETTYYEHYCKKYSNRGTNTDKIHSQVDNIDDLIDSIQSNGYRTNHRGGNVRNNRVGLRDKFEVLVVIGRDGTFFVWDGKHRFAIAHCLNLRIPVQVVCRHTQWQEIRDEIHDRGVTEEYSELRNHPDLQDILG